MAFHWAFYAFTGIALILLPHFGTAAKKEKQGQLESKVSQLLKLTAHKSYIKFNGDQFRDLARTAPRNYSIVMMATALGTQHRCGICGQAFDEFKVLANSYRYSPAYSNRLFFAMVDYDSAPTVFQALQLRTVPIFFHFPAKGKPKRNDQYDMGRFGFSAESLAKWVMDRTEVQVKVMRPPNYMMMVLLLAMTLGVLFIGYFKRKALEQVINRTNCAYLSLFIIFAMTSGQMWNHIRGPPMAHTDHNTGKVGYISGSSQFQFIAESYIIMLVYALGTVGWVLLSEQAPLLSKNPSHQSMMIILGLFLVTMVFSWLLSTLRMKHRGYPYHFLLK